MEEVHVNIEGEFARFDRMNVGLAGKGNQV